MTLQYLYGASVVVFAFGVVSVDPAYAQRRDGSLLPQEQSAVVTAVGCLVRGDAVRGGDKDKYVLARVRKGPVASVAEPTCSTDAGADALTLDNPEKAKMNDSMLGKWVEISGRLERETNKNPDDLRELDVASAKMVPVVIPRAAAAPAPAPAAPAAMAPRPAPAPAAAAPAPAPAPEPAPALPKTASPFAAIGLAGLFSLAGGMFLRSFRLGQRG